MYRRRGLGIALGALVLFSTLSVVHSQSPKPVRIAGVDWEPSFQQAQARAMREGKPIFQLHLFGRLNEEFC